MTDRKMGKDTHYLPLLVRKSVDIPDVFCKMAAHSRCDRNLVYSGQKYSGNFEKRMKWSYYLLM